MADRDRVSPASTEAGERPGRPAGEARAPAENLANVAQHPLVNHCERLSFLVSDSSSSLKPEAGCRGSGRDRREGRWRKATLLSALHWRQSSASPSLTPKLYHLPTKRAKAKTCEKDRNLGPGTLTSLENTYYSSLSVDVSQALRRV